MCTSSFRSGVSRLSNSSSSSSSEERLNSVKRCLGAYSEPVLPPVALLGGPVSELKALPPVVKSRDHLPFGITEFVGLPWPSCWGVPN
jgi:hypothetical protein